MTILVLKFFRKFESFLEEISYLPEVGFLICVTVFIRLLISQDHLSLKRSLVLFTDTETLFCVRNLISFNVHMLKVQNGTAHKIQIFSKVIKMLSVSVKLHLHFSEVKHQSWL